MKKSAFFAVGLLVAGSALASNTGFKLNYPLIRTSSTNLINWVSLPMFYFPNGNVSVSQQNAIDLCRDVNDFVTPPAKVSTVQRWKTDSNQYIGQSCTTTKLAFNIVSGEAYALNAATANVVVNIVGSMNDSYAPNKGGTSTYPLSFAPGFVLNWVSVPYHAIAENSIDLCRQWNTQTGNRINNVQRWKTDSNQYIGQSCTTSKLAFNVVPGEAYAVAPNATGVGIGFEVY